MSTLSWSPEHVRELVGKLTVEQKIAQLTGLMAPTLYVTEGEAAGTLALERVAALRPHGVGHLSLAWFLGRDAGQLRSSLAAVQDAVRETSPFGIAALVHNEGINGFLHASGSQFPTAWAQAAAWDPALVGRASSITAAHTRHAGMHLLFAPVLDLNRDPRWGRVHETYGEDPELAAQTAVAFVRGVQDGEEGEGGVLAAGKHFLGYGASEGGLNQAITQLGRRALIDEYAEPFRRAIAEAGLSAVMNSYNEIDGVPAAANRWLLTDLLRGQLGFDGLVVSDYDAVTLLRTAYRTAATEGEAARQSLSAGLDVELPGDDNFSALAAEIDAGRIGVEVLDTAVARVLTVKARLGLIPALRAASAATSAPAADPALPDAAPPDTAQAARVRREIAEKAVVLLANDGLLPLAPAGKRILVTGPAADELRIHFGAYTSVSHGEMPLGMRAIHSGQVAGIDPANFVFTDIFQARMPDLEPVFEAEARTLHPDAATVLQALRAAHPDAQITFAPLGSFTADPAHLDPEAVRQAASEADVIVAVVGERTGWVGINTAGEGQSTAEPTLPGDQTRLIELLAETGTPLAAVVVSGRPLLLERVDRAADAVLLAPLLGQEAGPVITAALTGALNPSGKLPSTFPRHLGQIPLYHGHHHGSGYGHPTGTRHGYGDLGRQGPLYPFGHGLSYTTFTLGFDKTAQPVATLSEDGIISARIRVTNTGTCAGQTVVQLYARDEHAGVVRPVRALVAFSRVSLAAGEACTVELTAPIERLHYTMPDGRRGIEPGDITVMAAFSSDEICCTTTVTVPADQGASRP